MPDLDQIIKLQKEIAEAKARFQAVAKPWMNSLADLVKSGANADYHDSPPELTALSTLIRQLEDELLMLDPTADVHGVENWYREAMFERQQRRLQIEAHGKQQLSAATSAIARAGLSEDGRTYIISDGQQVSLTTLAAQVLEILVDQWNKGSQDVSQAYVVEHIGKGDNIGSTRLRDRVGRATYKRLITTGAKKGTIRLLHPPSSQ